MKIRELFVASLMRLYARLLKQGFDIIPAGEAGIDISPHYKGDNAYFIGHDMSPLYRFLLDRNNNFRTAAVRASHSLLRGRVKRDAQQSRV